MIEIPYIAGFVDGEGSIGFGRSGKQKRLVPRISIVNTNREILEDIQSEYGGDIQPLTQRKPGWKQGWSWRLSNNKAVLFVELIEPYLRLKYNQAWLFFAYKAIAPGFNKKNREFWDADKLEAVELLNAQSKWLNLRGSNERGPEPMQVAYDAIVDAQAGQYDLFQ
jgi:hypothetical protein